MRRSHFEGKGPELMFEEKISFIQSSLLSQ